MAKWQKHGTKASPGKTEQDAIDLELVRVATMKRLIWADKKAALFDEDEDIDKSTKLSIIVQRLGKNRLDCYRIEHSLGLESDDGDDDRDFLSRVEKALEAEEDSKKTMMLIKEFISSYADKKHGTKRLLRDMPPTRRGSPQDSPQGRQRNGDLVRRVRIRKRPDAKRDPQSLD